MKWHTDYTDSLRESADLTRIFFFFKMVILQSCHHEELCVISRFQQKAKRDLKPRLFLPEFL